VELTDEAAGPAEPAVIVQQVEAPGPGERAGHEGEDLASALVDAERPRRAEEADLVQVGEQDVDSRRPGAGRAAHGAAHPDETAAHVAATERYLGASHRVALLGWATGPWRPP
jgi:hypothetical protein